VVSINTLLSAQQVEQLSSCASQDGLSSRSQGDQSSQIHSQGVSEIGSQGDSLCCGPLSRARTSSTVLALSNMPVVCLGLGAHAAAYQGMRINIHQRPFSICGQYLGLLMPESTYIPVKQDLARNAASDKIDLSVIKVLSTEDLAHLQSMKGCDQLEASKDCAVEGSDEPEPTAQLAKIEVCGHSVEPSLGAQLERLTASADLSADAFQSGKQEEGGITIICSQPSSKASSLSSISDGLNEHDNLLVTVDLSEPQTAEKENEWEFSDSGFQRYLASSSSYSEHSSWVKLAQPKK